VDDFFADGNQSYMIFLGDPASTDLNYGSLTAGQTPDMAAQTIDNDTPGFLVTYVGPIDLGNGRLITTESGGQATFTIRLTSRPLNGASVTVNFTSSNPLEGAVAPPSITIPDTNWSTPYTITLTGVNDTPSVADGTVAYQINLTTASADPPYNAAAVGPVLAENVDDDGLVVTMTGGSNSVVEGGATDTILVAIGGTPTANVVVTVTNSSQLTGTPVTLVFTPANANTPQVITLTAVDDTLVESGHTGTITLTTSSADVNYNNLSQTVTAGIGDNDLPPEPGFCFASAGASEIGASGGLPLAIALLVGVAILAPRRRGIHRRGP
jgi:hypothetical protein